MRHLFLINPKAGKHTRPRELSSRIHAVMAGRNQPYDIRFTESRGHAQLLTKQAAANAPEPIQVYAFGGDGTLNEVVNGAAEFDHAAVGVYPIGSGNDFLKLFTTGAERFRHLDAVVDGKPTPLDLIECNGRLALNIASVGLDARVGVDMAHFKHLPLVSGPMAYILSLVSNVAKGIGEHYRVTLDGERFEGDYTLAAVCNGRFYGGGFCPVPDAVPDDGLLDIVLVRQVSRLKVAQLVKQYAGGFGRFYPSLIRIRRGRTLRVEGDRTLTAQLDGEELLSPSLSFRLCANRLRFLIPDGASWSRPAVPERRDESDII